MLARLMVLFGIIWNMFGANGKVRNALEKKNFTHYHHEAKAEMQNTKGLSGMSPSEAESSDTVNLYKLTKATI